MPQYILTFDNVNSSLQVGDNAYYSDSFANVGGFQGTQLSNTYLIGPILSMVNNAIANPGSTGWTVTIDHTSGSLGPQPTDYISFAKNKVVNTSSLVGYYANAKFVNDSTDKIELFGVGSEISESSK
tara:strand:+ start:2601 stop:2981 length:381 start_codon:yes stop_codon:yes gene_type:complete